MTLAQLIGALENPGAYPHKPSSVTIIQTHISVICIADDLVYKIKKPVDFGFLDFTTLEKRKFFCNEELMLNRRLCPDIYLGVEPITDDGGSITVGGRGRVIDYAVVMKRMPEDLMMDVLLREGRVTRGDMTRIVEVLVPFYKTARTGPDVDRFGTLPVIGLNCDENFNQTRPYIGRSVTPEDFESVKEFVENTFQKKGDIFEERVRGGFIREGHGDLHSRNICLTPETVYIYDCIEFNERFRMGDVAQDIAFLSMDLDFFRYPGLSRHFIEEYVRLSGDGRLPDLIDFYASYHAFARGKVLSFELGEAEIDSGEKESARRRAESYFHLAHHYAVRRTSPFLIITFGLAGSGKSRVADRLAEELDCVILRSDEVRKELLGIDPLTRRRSTFGTGIYSAQMSKRTYDALFDRAARILSEHRSVILDACFLKAGERKAARSVAEKAGARFLVTAVSSPDDVVIKRIKKRMKQPGVSDADYTVYQKQKLLCERLSPEENGNAVGIDTTGSEQENIRRIVGRLLLGVEE